MIPIAFTAAAVAMAAVAAHAQADMVRDCLCVLSRHDHSIPREEFPAADLTTNPPPKPSQHAVRAVPHHPTLLHLLAVL